MRVKLVLENARLPKRSNPTDAGADLFSPIDIVIPAHGFGFIDLGFQMELPANTAGFIVARSGIGTKKGIVPRQCIGTVDEPYRNNVGIMVENKGDEDFQISIGDRIAQLVIVPVLYEEMVESDNLDMTQDRMGGFGSTGK